MMRTEATAPRQVPFTANRAFTEVMQCRRHLDAAVHSLELAVEILTRLNGEGDRSSLAVMEEVLGRLEEAEAALLSTLGPPSG